MGRHLVYTTQTQGLEKGTGLAYRHARYFTRPESGVACVTVCGDFPAIVDAYRAKGIPVVKPEHESPVEQAAPAEPKAEVEAKPRRPRGRPRKVVPDGVSD